MNLLIPLLPSGEGARRADEGPEYDVSWNYVASPNPHPNPRSAPRPAPVAQAFNHTRADGAQAVWFHPEGRGAK